jgi:hypothetical protein
MQRLARNEVRVGATALVITIATVVGLIATADPGPPKPSTEIGSNHIQPPGDQP